MKGRAQGGPSTHLRFTSACRFARAGIMVLFWPCVFRKEGKDSLREWTVQRGYNDPRRRCDLVQHGLSFASRSSSFVEITQEFQRVANRRGKGRQVWFAWPNLRSSLAITGKPRRTWRCLSASALQRKSSAAALLEDV